MSTELALRLMPAPPEWRRSGPYLLLALALHTALLLAGQPLHKALDELVTAKPLSVTLLKPPAPLPIAAARPEPVRQAPAANRERTPPRPTPTPVLAMPPEQQAVVSAPTVVAAPPAPAPVSEAPGKPVATASGNAATLSAARFDAAYLQNPKPNYPAMSRRLGEEGKVLLKVRVGSDGKALAVDLEKSSNFERLDNAARQVVLSWRFVPAKRGEEAIEASVIVPIVFRLDS